jgi:hypothetical protein
VLEKLAVIRQLKAKNYKITPQELQGVDDAN